MCLVTVFQIPHVYQTSTLVLLSNREELFGRETERLSAFASVEGGSRKMLVGGRDAVAHGTWLAIDPISQCIGILTNLRRGKEQQQVQQQQHKVSITNSRLKSRGNLILKALSYKDDEEPRERLLKVSKDEATASDNYEGFNLTLVHLRRRLQKIPDHEKVLACSLLNRRNLDFEAENVLVDWKFRDDSVLVLGNHTVDVDREEEGAGYDRKQKYCKSLVNKIKAEFDITKDVDADERKRIFKLGSIFFRQILQDFNVNAEPEESDAAIRNLSRIFVPPCKFVRKNGGESTLYDWYGTRSSLIIIDDGEGTDNIYLWERDWTLLWNQLLLNSSENNDDTSGSIGESIPPSSWIGDHECAGIWLDRLFKMADCYPLPGGVDIILKCSKETGKVDKVE